MKAGDIVLITGNNFNPPTRVHAWVQSMDKGIGLIARVREVTVNKEVYLGKKGRNFHDLHNFFFREEWLTPITSIDISIGTEVELSRKIDPVGTSRMPWVEELDVLIGTRATVISHHPRPTVARYVKKYDIDEIEIMHNNGSQPFTVNIRSLKLFSDPRAKEIDYNRPASTSQRKGLDLLFGPAGDTVGGWDYLDTPRNGRYDEKID